MSLLVFGFALYSEKYSKVWKVRPHCIKGHRGIYEIQSRFKAYIGNRNEQFYTAVDIESALLHLNIPFEKEIKTTFIQLPPQGSVEMKWLIAFLQQDEENISNNIVQEVESWILAKTSDKMAHDVSFWLGNAMLKNK